MRRLLVVVALAGALLVGAAGAAQAHATLTESSPKDGASLSKPPSEVTLTYDENLRDPSVVIVTAPDGKRVDHGDSTVLDNTVSVAVHPREAGRYRVSYRVVSADGHPVAGTLSFRVTTGTAAGDGSGDAAREESSAGVRPWLIGGAAVVVVAGAVVLMTRRSRDDEDAA